MRTDTRGNLARFVASLALAFALASSTPCWAVALPAVGSANLTYHIDAHDINNDGGATAPADGANIPGWAELTTGAGLNIQSTPSYQATAIAGGPAVRFDGGPSGGDLVFSNNAAIFNISARTIYGVSAMATDAHILSNLVSNSSGTATIRQTIAETPDYFSGNTADFHTLSGGSGGSFAINGNPTFAVPGGFGAAHVVRSISPSVTNINSFRIGDNANNRLYAGDVAEMIVYDGVLDGDDTARVNKYLIDKYGITQVVDETVTASSQVARRPFTAPGNDPIGVNFNYNGPAVGTTFKGIGFDDIDLAGAGALTGTFPLTANAATAGATLTLNFPFTVDNTPRTQSAGITGTDSATLNAVANEMFYVSQPGSGHDSAGMTFNGLEPDVDVYVQVLGGDDGWNGDIQVLINGTTTADWTTVADSNDTTGSLFGFFATTDGAGQLQLDFTVPVGNFAGIGGLILTQAVPEPSTFALAALGLLTLGLRRRRRRA